MSLFASLAASAARMWRRSAPQSTCLTLGELVARFMPTLPDRYRKKSGRVTSTPEAYRLTLDELCERFRDLPIADFSPRRLKDFRAKLIARDLKANTINTRVGRILRMLRWAVGEELIDESILRRLKAVECLRKDDATLRPPKVVKPVDDAIVQATLRHMSLIPADIVRLQQLTGTRSGELLGMRPIDIERSSEIWCYTPIEHKTEHHHITRIIHLGPKSQAILAPYLDRPADRHCFSPRDDWHAGKLMLDVRTRYKHQRYSRNAYAEAIKIGCERAFGMPEELQALRRLHYTQHDPALHAAAIEWRKKHCWHPHQLRHSAATEIAKTYDEFASKAVLGHTTLQMTMIYAQRGNALAEKVAREMG
jgi:integrase